MATETKPQPKHTQGDWTYDYLGEHAWVLSEDGRTYLLESVNKDSEGLFIQDPKEREANVRLAALAPQLLKAVQRLLPLAERAMSVISDEFYNGEGASEELAEALAATTAAHGLIRKSHE